MCYDCYIVRADAKPKAVINCGQLAAEFSMGVTDLPLNCDEARDPLEECECFCWVDFPALASRFGMKCEEPSFAGRGLNNDAWVLTETAP
ncbi:hypothetical protein J2D73_18585 [Acetobacter sacchari]|uniref:Uncharacterized protein n=1 Tax=Acetobacter sacchari TaxID=2661687 RepID=A0ABS3M0W1_9PROT|nr:hypothetical protein [Acetobacter sacchari]MBO1361793.1 hypothetical protein [Acetobacter sacchari]